MTTYHFTLEVIGVDPTVDGFEDRFYGNGVDDALVYVSDGRVFLAFDREDRSEGAAIDSAAHAVNERGGKVVNVIHERDLRDKSASA